MTELFIMVLIIVSCVLIPCLIMSSTCSIESEKEMPRIIVHPNDMPVLLSREHVLGYLHALEEFTTGMSTNITDEHIELSDAKVAAYHEVIVDYLDELRTKAARDLGRLELTNNTIWMDD